MARSTKIQKIVTDALATRVTATESGITAIQSRDLVDVGDNVSTLANDAQYQTLAQVQNKLDALINSAPGTLDTLGEIAAKLATEDSAIAALVAQDTENSTAISALQTSSSNLESNYYALADVINSLQDKVYARFGIQRQIVTFTSIGSNLQLEHNSPSTQNIINTSGETYVVLPPIVPQTYHAFEIINHITSTNNISFAGETILPGTRHAVQWDGVEWVVM